MAVVEQAGALYQIQAFNETVSVVEAATSIFDPQMYVTPSRMSASNLMIK